MVTGKILVDQIVCRGFYGIVRFCCVAEQFFQVRAGIRVGVRGGCRQCVDADGFVFLVLRFQKLSEVIAYIAILRELQDAEEFPGVREIAAVEMNPAQSVPIGGDILNFGEITMREVIDVEVAKRRGGGIDCGLGVGFGFFKIEISLDEIVGDVVPNFGRGR